MQPIGREQMGRAALDEWPAAEGAERAMEALAPASARLSVSAADSPQYSLSVSGVRSHLDVPIHYGGVLDVFIRTIISQRICCCNCKSKNI